MILAFLIISLVIWTLSCIVNLYTIAEQSKESNISSLTTISLGINLVMLTLNIFCITVI
jgi:hypothetical protein